MSISNHDKLACVTRELRLRVRVYDRLISRGKMTATERDREIALMTAIVADYEALTAADEPDLFTEREERL